MRKLEERERAAMEGDRSKRKFNSLEGGGGEHVTPEEMEAYRIKKGRGDDPLAALVQAQTGPGSGSGTGTVGYDLL
jgi:pre-mRNA-processing factor SLU7